uniref:Secreted protein n=2 Tax=Lutzomyia longipalpis TaxID=7200 RepID=A0A1B0GI46_LUTLO
MKLLLIFVVFCIGTSFGQNLCPPTNIPVCCHYPDGSTMTFTNACVLESHNEQNGLQCDSIAQGACEGVTDEGIFHILPFPKPMIHPRRD